MFVGQKFGHFLLVCFVRIKVTKEKIPHGAFANDDAFAKDVAGPKTMLRVWRNVAPGPQHCFGPTA